MNLRPAPSHWRILFWAAMLAVIVLSLLPAIPHMPSTGWDKSNHLLGFGSLALLARLAYPDRAAAVQMPALLAYGGLIEILQAMTSYRFAEWADLLADSLGIALGWCLASAGMRLLGGARRKAARPGES